MWSVYISLRVPSGIDHVTKHLVWKTQQDRPYLYDQH